MRRTAMTTLVVYCRCGGWVMLAALGHNLDADADYLREAARKERKGFRVERIPSSGVAHIDPCKHRGTCTTAPHRVPDERQMSLLEKP